jgi:PTS system fructose-specific IIC component
MKFVGVSSCPTGIAHTYMAAEALEQEAKAQGHTIVVETQGSAGTIPIDQTDIDAADGVIFAADLEVRDKQRFAGKPTIDVGVKKAVHDPKGVLADAIAAVEAARSNPQAAASPTAPPPASRPPAAAPGAGSRIRQYLMTGVSYMIPFVAAGGILIALGFMIGGYEIALPVDQGGISQAMVATDFQWGDHRYWGALLLTIGQLTFAFLLAALSGYIAYAIADRPGLVPGFTGGAVAGLVGAGFLGALVTGFLAGFLALWISRWKVAKGVRGVMPVVVTPLLATLITGLAMILVLGRPLKWVLDQLTEWLNSLTGANAIVLGLILGLMMCFDLGGPVNKTAYVFATTGLAVPAVTATSAVQFQIMAAVMAAGMVPPLGLALATTIRGRLFTPAERENGKAAWLLGLSFISEGAIPFAAAHPLVVLPSSMVGGAATGALVMAFDNNLRAPHGGVWVLPLVSGPFTYLLAIAVGTAITAALVMVLMAQRQRKLLAADEADVGAMALHS